MATTVTANESSTLSALAQVVDIVTAPGYKWFSLQDNKLDGSYHPMDSSKALQVGWWGTSLSNTTGTFTTAPVLTITMDAQLVPTMRVTGDSLLNEFPVDFTIGLYDAVNTLLRTITVTGNTSVMWKQAVVPTVDNVTKIVLTVTKVNKASRTIKLVDTINVFEFYKADTLTPKLADIHSSHNVSLIRPETLTPKVAESSTERVSFTRPDILAPNLADAHTTHLVRTTRPDTLTPKVLDIHTAQQVSFTRPDVLTPKLGESKQVTASFTRPDILTPKTDEALRQVTAQLTRPDSLTPKVDDIHTTHQVGLVRPDSLTPKVAESSSERVSFTKADTLTPKLVESKQITAQLTRSDLLTPNLTDMHIFQRVSLTRTDSVLTALIDVSFFSRYEIWKSDIIAPKLGEVDSQQVSFTRPDTLTPKTDEGKQITASFTRPDILTPKMSEARQVTAQLNRPDTLAPKITDVHTSHRVNLTRPDTLTPKVAETKQVKVTIVRTEILKPKTDESRQITNRFTRTEILLVRANVEVDDVIAYLYRPDNLLVSGHEEVTYMDNIYIAMDKDVRQVFGKVEITYTDPFSDESVQYTASENAPYTPVATLADAVETPAYKWFSLHDNKLDGSYHPLPSSNAYSPGWWGTQLSDASGTLVTPVVVTVVFAARSLTEFKLVGDSLLNVFPVDFALKAYDAANTLLYTKPVTGNTLVSWYSAIDPFIAGVAKIELSITKINKPNCVVKLLELFTAIVETYTDDDIVSLHLLEEVGYSNGSLPIGNISANELDITLSNIDRRFDLNNTQSKLRGYIKRNRRVRAWLGAYVAGAIEWHPLGTFWTTQWDIRKTTLVANLTARDRLELLRLTDFMTSQVYVNQTLYWLFETILLNAGLTVTEYDIDVDLKSIVIPYAWFGRMKHREALARLANCAMVQVYCTKDNTIKVNYNFKTTPTVIMNFDDDINVIDAQHPVAVKEQVNSVEVTAQQRVVSASMELFKTIIPVTVPANNFVIRSYQFDNTPVVSISGVTIIAPAGIVVTSFTTYSWGMEVKLTNSTAAAIDVTEIKATGTMLTAGNIQVLTSKDTNLIREDGEVKQTLNHDFIQNFAYAQSLADGILINFKNSRTDVVITGRGNPALRLGDRAKYDGMDYSVTRQSIDWGGALDAITEGKKL